MFSFAYIPATWFPHCASSFSVLITSLPALCFTGDFTFSPIPGVLCSESSLSVLPQLHTASAMHVIKAQRPSRECPTRSKVLSGHYLHWSASKRILSVFLHFHCFTLNKRPQFYKISALTPEL